MNLWDRLYRHLWLPGSQLRRAFPNASRAAIERAVEASERGHHGEIRVCIESALPLGAVVRGKSGRERALEVFSELRVWDTEQNTGVLIYVLMADRDLESLADRAAHRCVPQATWDHICSEMEQRFRAGEMEAGVIAAVEAVSKILTEHFPASGENVNELANRPVIR